MIGGGVMLVNNEAKPILAIHPGRFGRARKITLVTIGFETILSHVPMIGAKNEGGTSGRRRPVAGVES